ncbi:MAG TPA: translation elongation factor 4 [Herpetosiphonaceae bacterium]
MHDLSKIRNFSIIAHIDHGKTTLSDRLLELTKTVSAREMQEQTLDSMDLERERGITIKSHPVRLEYKAKDGETYFLHMVDCPGHVDFAAEVERALQACEGALLIVDASQGIEAQTLSNVYLALEANLEMVPILNKIDLPGAEIDLVSEEVEHVLGLPRADIILASGKQGTGVPDILEAIVERIPPPEGDISAPAQALIFDSHYDAYKGVIAYVRIMNGSIKRGDKLYLMGTEVVTDAMEVGTFRPKMVEGAVLSAGEVGYIATGLKTVVDCQVGDTITLNERKSSEPLAPFKPAKPMVFAGLYPVDSNDYGELRESLDKLKLNDAALSYEPETSAALGFGFRAGFLGLLHMDIVQERLEREYKIDLLVTAPSVEYQVLKTNGDIIVIDNPSELPDVGLIEEIEEPVMEISVVVPSRYIGVVMELVTGKRGTFISMDYLDKERVVLKYEIPLAEIVIDFYDTLKSRTQGYASLDYHLSGYRVADLVKLDVLVNTVPVDALSMITHRLNAQRQGRQLVEKLQKLIPRQMFEVPVQAAVGSKVIARETIKAIRKDVLSKCYGGDISRKRKLLEKQKEGKKRMKMVGNVEIPQDAFMAVLRLED